MTEDKEMDETTDGGAGAEAGADPGQMSEAELREALEKQFRETNVSDMLVQYLASLSHIGYVKMGLTEETLEVKDMAQASLAIDAFKAMLEAVKERLDSQDASALEGALSSMQMTFAQAGAAGDDSAKAEAVGDETASADDDASAPEDKKSAGDDPSSRLWVPGKE
jgi:hypothetical protein